MNILGIIPARYASSRFPGKVLADIRGKTMVERVFLQACRAKHLTEVLIATDDERVFDAAQRFGAPVVMTRPEHPSGTDRCYEALQNQPKSYDFVVNIQGDEPFIRPEQIDLLTATLTSREVEIATLVHTLDDEKSYNNPNVVKVVLSQRQEAMYFSRSPIPYRRNTSVATPLYRHIGLYAYRTDILQSLTALSPSVLEQIEGLEQLRWLENGYRIRVAHTPFGSQGVDTPEDLARLLATS